MQEGPPSSGLASIPIDPKASTSAHHNGSLGMKVLLAGASNQTAALFTNAFDLVKVRQQLQLTSHTASGKVRSTPWTRTLIEMIKSEGILSIYKGLSASLLREGCYSGIRMGLYDFSKGVVLRVAPFGDKDSFGIKLLAGGASGCLGAAIANPADLMKVQMQRVGATGSLRETALGIYRANGLAGFYRAVLPTTARAGILTASQLGTYDHAKHTLMVDFPEVFPEGFQTHLAASGVAGFVCSAASSPVDVVKVRMMSDVTGKYKSAVHCAVLTMRYEGPLAFYKGFTMSFLRLWPHSVLSLLVFEQLRKVAGLNPI